MTRPSPTLGCFLREGGREREGEREKERKREETGEREGRREERIKILKKERREG